MPHIQTIILNGGGGGGAPVTEAPAESSIAQPTDAHAPVDLTGKTYYCNDEVMHKIEAMLERLAAGEMDEWLKS